MKKRTKDFFENLADGQKDKNINVWNSDCCHSLHNSSFGVSVKRRAGTGAGVGVGV